MRPVSSTVQSAKNRVVGPLPANMYLTYVRHRLKEYDVWKKAFDANAHMLKANGVLSTRIVRKFDDPNVVIVINTWPAKENWDAFIAAHNFKTPEDARKQQQAAGVIGMPEFVDGEVVE